MYRENWDNVQISFFDPGLVGNIFYDTNGQNFVIKGIETSLVAPGAQGLTLQGAGSWNHSRQTNSPALIDNNPGERELRQAHTQACNCPGTGLPPVTNPFGPIGAPSADAPPIQFSLRARYDWNIDGYTPFVQFGATHNGHSFTQAGSNPDLAGPAPSPPDAALRESRLLDLRCFARGCQGCLVRERLWRELEQFECQHVCQHRPVHRRADAAAAAGNRLSFGSQILTALTAG